MDRAEAGPAGREMDAGTGRNLDHLTGIALIGRPPGDEMTEFIARNRQGPLPWRADPKAGLRRIAAETGIGALEKQATAGARGTGETIWLLAPIGEIVIGERATDMRRAGSEIGGHGFDVPVVANSARKLEGLSVALAGCIFAAVFSQRGLISVLTR